MKGSINTSVITNFISKHHPFIFTVSILLIIAGSVFSLYQIVNDVLSKPILPSSSVTSFDSETIEKIQKLHDSDIDTATLIIPSGRYNPFIE